MGAPQSHLFVPGHKPGLLIQHAHRHIPPWQNYFTRGPVPPALHQRPRPCTRYSTALAFQRRTPNSHSAFSATSCPACEHRQHAQASVPEMRRSISFQKAAAAHSNGSRLQKSGQLFCLEKPVISPVLGHIKNCSTLIGGPSMVCLYGFRSCSRILKNKSYIHYTGILTKITPLFHNILTFFATILHPQ